MTSVPSPLGMVVSPLLDSHWLHGKKPKETVPLIFAASSKKNWKVREACRMRLGSKIKIPTQVSMAHTLKFIGGPRGIHVYSYEYPRFGP